MSARNQNLSKHHDIPSAGTKRFGIVVSEWNKTITYALLSGALDTLKQAGAVDEQIEIIKVPGSFELPFAANLLAKRKNIDAIICLGCVIQGETPHFDFVCQACAYGIMKVGLKHKKPCIFGVLTTLNNKQAAHRSGGKHGNKGVEAAVTALKMLSL